MYLYMYDYTQTLETTYRLPDRSGWRSRTAERRSLRTRTVEEEDEEEVGERKEGEIGGDGEESVVEAIDTSTMSLSFPSVNFCSC